MRDRLAALLLAACVVLTCGGDGAVEPPWVEIRGQRVSLELAVTRSEQQKGLGERDSLAWDRGMLFRYERAGFYGFWMKGMRFDIDIVWLRDGRIVDISHDVRHVPAGSPLPTYQPRELVDTVLEVPSGYARAHGWRVGDHAAWDLAQPG